MELVLVCACAAAPICMSVQCVSVAAQLHPVGSCSLAPSRYVIKDAAAVQAVVEDVVSTWEFDQVGPTEQSTCGTMIHVHISGTD
jgi:hypothetical protein